MFVKSEPDGSPHRRAQALAAEFAEILRGSYWAKESRLSSLVPVADGLARELPRDQAVQDLARMVRRAADIKEGEGATTASRCGTSNRCGVDGGGPESARP